MFNSIINSENTLILWAIILVIATIAIFLENRYTLVAKISGAIMALIIALLLSNFNIKFSRNYAWCSSRILSFKRIYSNFK